jgi:hypothetical protein
MTSSERSALPISFFAQIASAVDDVLSNLKNKYKKHSITSIRAKLHSIRRTVSEKVYRKQKEKEEIITELSNEHGWDP